ncbi:MAG: hypothetical protein ISN28_06750 [Ectothiorhodospiraceae bacterium AqS1]|nr:hypothetical protein [Ectothiorhodospiraceae bacterium AqS1]
MNSIPSNPSTLPVKAFEKNGDASLTKGWPRVLADNDRIERDSGGFTAVSFGILIKLRYDALYCP